MKSLYQTSGTCLVKTQYVVSYVFQKQNVFSKCVKSLSFTTYEPCLVKIHYVLLLCCSFKMRGPKVSNTIVFYNNFTYLSKNTHVSNTHVSRYSYFFKTIVFYIYPEPSAHCARAVLDHARSKS